MSTIEELPIYNTELSQKNNKNKCEIWGSVFSSTENNLQKQVGNLP